MGTKFVFLILVLLSSEKFFCQSLSIEETLDYLNKIRTVQQNLVDVQTERVTIDKEGYFSKMIVGKDYYYDNSGKSYSKIDTSFITINVSDIDMDEINLYEYNTAPHIVEINCKAGIACLKGGGGAKILWHISDSYDAKRFHRALVYLINLASDLGYKRKDENDPFVRMPYTKSTKSQLKGTTTEKASIVPLKEENGVFTLTVSIGSTVSKFILDSGAGESNISYDLERRLLANGIIRQKDYLSNGLFRLADGSVQECRRVRIPKMTIGNKTLYGVNVSISPSNSANLVGQSFLNRTNRWTIDNERKKLILE